ncbi:MAG: peptidase M23 [Hyphomicrobium sp.]|nr:peptidase M23 [Hyphomicrobium sp.]PPD07010.1 MAG: peptidase M23 [Hyphomicrobium sp.]
MSSFLRSGSSGRRSIGRQSKLLAIAAALAAGGCSADIARFDFPASANFNDPSTASIAPNERSALGAEPVIDDAPPPAAYNPPPPVERKIEVATLPPPVSEPEPVARQRDLPPPATSFAPPPPSVDPQERGQEIEVQRGDTLYGISKRHNVSLNELMRVNNLTSPALKPGQKLALPSGKAVARPRPAPAPVVAAVPAPAEWTGSYTIKAGDSLYNVARQNKVKLDDLQRYNGIADVRRVKPGTVLKIPGVAGAVMAEAPATPTSAPALTPPAQPPVTANAPSVPMEPAAPSATPKILNSGANDEKKVAALDPGTAAAVTNPAPASGSVADGKLRWPAKGRIIAGFGPRSDGTHNDGINISVPNGTDIHAAETGSVAYAGSELKGYGNLILVRHDNGLVTAYAHASEILVKRGDRVNRGQVIAKAGKTGAVDQPQLHFEVRRDQTPVDPTGYLEKN